MLIAESAHAQDVIKASGGTNLSIDSVNVQNGGYTTLDGPTIRETASGQLKEGQSVVLTLPAGFIWNDALTANDITITIEPTGSAVTQLEVSFGGITQSKATFTIDKQSKSGGNGQGPGRVEIQGLQLKPDTLDAPYKGQISNTGGTGADANYGNLSTAVGAISAVNVETAADGSGQIVPAQDLLAGESVTVYAIGRDIGDNFVQNVALNTEGDWSFINTTGSVQQTALSASTDLKSATFSSQKTGTAQIQANYSGASLHPSETLTVLPREADKMVINTQPSSTATAGQAFSTQPVIFLKDQFGNKVTTDNTTQVTASINPGEGSLSGTQTRTASSGEITFTDLYATVKSTITLKFESADLSTITSNEIVINPASASDLKYIQQPSNTAQNGTISPPVKLQLLDQFGNTVETSGTTVSINNENFFKTNSTLSNDTDTNGIATFSNLNITDNATTGEITLTSQFSGISSPVTSNTFLITSADGLSRYDITNTSGANISEQQAGTSFDITINAKQGDGDNFTFSSDSTLTITADNTIQGGSFDVTIPSGSSSINTSLVLTSTGTTKIYADASENISGESNSFNVIPSNNIDPTKSIITADPVEITADGNSTSTITVQLKDEFGNDLTSGGETVELTTTAGTFSGGVTSITANDQNDGTYTAVLTSSTDASETASVSGTVNSNGISDGATVNFVPGEVVAFNFTLPQVSGSPATQTAGTAFNIDVDAVDDLGNVVSSFDGSVTFSSNSTISSGGSASFTNGELNNHSITLTKAVSNATLTASADNLYNVSGTSNSFIIIPNEPDASQSLLTAIPSTIQNNSSSQSVITITLRDAYQNKIYQQRNVSLSLEQLEKNNTSSSGSPDATLANGSNLPFNSTNGTYKDTLNATTTIELVRITGFFGSSSTQIAQTDTVDIVVPNTWEGDAQGPTSTATDWTNPENWSQGTVPGSSDFVIIPDVENLPVLDLNIDLSSFEIRSGVSLTLFGGNAINVSGNMTLNGTLNSENNTSITIRGNFAGSGSFATGDNTTVSVSGNVSVTSFLARTTGSQITLNGSTPQVISTTDFLAQNLNIQNDINATLSNKLIDVLNLNISADKTLELNLGAGDTLDVSKDITGNGTLLLNDNTLVLGGDINLSNIDASEATVIFGVRLDQNPSNFNLSEQQIASLQQMKNVVVNNDKGVRTTEDIEIPGNLTLQNGSLIISSGKSLIAPNQSYVNGSLKVLRTIHSKGWVMMSSPVATTFNDLLTELTVQGITGSTYPDKQPNLLYYNETISGTENQRWRKPNDINEPVHSTNTDSLGRGYFFYVFGDVSGDTLYNDSLPVTLSVSGEEYQHQSNTFNFSSVTYTADADTGWNLIGNPWASTIDWDSNGWTKTNMDNVIYIWDHSTNEYKEYNGIDGDPELSNGLIKPFQAFWVKANGQGTPELSVDKTAKSTGGNFLKTSKKKPASIEFLLEKGSLEKTSHITLSPDGKNGKDRRDAYRLLPFETDTYLELYFTLEDGTQLSINNLARSFGKELTIPIYVGGFKNGNPLTGNYTLSWPDMGDVPDAWIMTLKDRKTGEKIDLRKNTFYSFNLSQTKGKTAVNNTIHNFRLTEQPDSLLRSKAKTDDSRFVLRIKPGADAAGIPNEYALGINYPNPFRESTTIKYQTPLEGNVQILVYDILGRKVKTLLNSDLPADYHKLKWTPNQLASGVYLIVMRADGKQFTKKITYIR